MRIEFEITDEMAEEICHRVKTEMTKRRLFIKEEFMSANTDQIISSLALTLLKEFYQGRFDAFL